MCREADKYLIQWKASEGKTKLVKRLNLFFEDESSMGFRFRLRQARRRKEQVCGEAGQVSRWEAEMVGARMGQASRSRERGG